MNNQMNLYHKRLTGSRAAVALMLMSLCYFAGVDSVHQTAAASTYGARLANFQGQLLNDQGLPYSPGSYDMEITLYDAPVGGNAVWGPVLYDGEAGMGHASRVYVGDQGNFNVILGDRDIAGRDFLQSMNVATTSSLFLEYRAGNLATATPSTPRQQLLSVPYAIQAYNVPQFPGIHVAANSNVGIGVTNPAAKLEVDGDIKVRGQAQADTVQSESLTVDDGTVNGTFEAGSLTVAGSLNVTGNITPKGPITFLRHSTDWVEQTSNAEYIYDVLPDPEQQWQCFLSGIRMGSADDDTRHTNCKVVYADNAWQLFVTTTYNWQTECAATCIKIR